MADEDSPSPKSRLKFLCSHGGRIIPRPSDGQLRYVGGETRVLVVPRSIPFSDLRARINAMFGAEVVIKYQLMPEDLDAFVSVRSDEDLRYMIEEYDRPLSPTSLGSPRFRLYLFSAALASASTSPTFAAEEAARREGGGGMHRVRSTPNFGAAAQGSPPASSPRWGRYSPAYGAAGSWRGGPHMTGCACGCHHRVRRCCCGHAEEAGARTGRHMWE